jgi:hypothetical protein
MRRYHNRVRVLSLFALGFLGLLAPAATCWSQDDKEPTVHRLNIYNGAELSSYYSGKGLSAAEQASLDEYEQAQNDLSRALAEQAAVGQPVRTVNRWVKNDWSYSIGDPYGWGYGYGPGSGGYNSPLLLPYGSLGYYDYTYYGITFTNQSSSGVEVTTTEVPVADVLKAAQVSRDRVAAARKRLDAALDRVHKSDRLRKVLGLPKRD